MTAPVIVIDTRERTPWLFGDYPTVRQGLRTADYSLNGYTEPPDGIAIERKAPSDLLGCMSRSRERFLRELERLAEYQHAFVVVETDLNRVVTDMSLSQMSPASRIGTLVAWWHRYPTVQWLFVPGPAFAARLALRIFDRHVRDQDKTETGASAEVAA